MQHSILDRLIDLDPQNSRESVQYRHLSYSQARFSVGRDLENLLNTKRFTPPVPESCSDVERSVYLYGLSDFTSQNPGSPAVRAELRTEIAHAVALFEPRLRNVSVHVEEPDKKEWRLRFRITALLQMERASEPVSFDTFFDINRGEYLVPK